MDAHVVVSILWRKPRTSFSIRSLKLDIYPIPDLYISCRAVLFDSSGLPIASTTRQISVVVLQSRLLSDWRYVDATIYITQSSHPILGSGLLYCVDRVSESDRRQV